MLVLGKERNRMVIALQESRRRVPPTPSVPPATHADRELGNAGMDTSRIRAVTNERAFRLQEICSCDALPAIRLIAICRRMAHD